VPQSENLDAEGRQQPADLPVLSLIENDLKPAVAGSTAQNLHSLGKKKLPIRSGCPCFDSADYYYSDK
jgi:hypothetical protein